MELRKDYILNRRVIYAAGRKKRPMELLKREEVKEKGLCFFCPGDEALTPPEIGRAEEKGRWKIRWFLNKFPFLSEEKAEIEVKSSYFDAEAAYGKHEVIVECREHKKQMWDLPKEHIQQILEVYKNRIIDLSKMKGIRHVTIFKNHGKEAGTSLVHSHTQLAATHVIPTLIREEMAAIEKYDSCPYCDIIKIEGKGKRRCYENKSMVAFAPYASRFNYEIWFFPKRHVSNITKLDSKETADLADILKKALVKLKRINASYNFFLHYAPKDKFHFHIELTPRIATWGGFEHSTGITINSVTPEDAARFYKR